MHKKQQQVRRTRKVKDPAQSILEVRKWLDSNFCEGNSTNDVQTLIKKQNITATVSTLPKNSCLGEGPSNTKSDLLEDEEYLKFLNKIKPPPSYKFNNKEEFFDLFHQLDDFKLPSFNEVFKDSAPVSFGEISTNFNQLHISNSLINIDHNIESSPACLQYKVPENREEQTELLSNMNKLQIKDTLKQVKDGKSQTVVPAKCKTFFSLDCLQGTPKKADHWTTEATLPLKRKTFEDFSSLNQISILNTVPRKASGTAQTADFCEIIDLTASNNIDVRYQGKIPGSFIKPLNLHTLMPDKTELWTLKHGVSHEQNIFNKNTSLDQVSAIKNNLIQDTSTSLNDDFCTATDIASSLSAFFSTNKDTKRRKSDQNQGITALNQNPLETLEHISKIADIYTTRTCSQIGQTHITTQYLPIFMRPENCRLTWIYPEIISCYKPSKVYGYKAYPLVCKPKSQRHIMPTLFKDIKFQSLEISKRNFYADRCLFSTPPILSQKSMLWSVDSQKLAHVLSKFATHTNIIPRTNSAEISFCDSSKLLPHYNLDFIQPENCMIPFNKPTEIQTTVKVSENQSVVNCKLKKLNNKNNESNNFARTDIEMKVPKKEDIQTTFIKQISVTNSGTSSMPLINFTELENKTNKSVNVLKADIEMTVFNKGDIQTTSKNQAKVTEIGCSSMPSITCTPSPLIITPWTPVTLVQSRAKKSSSSLTRMKLRPRVSGDPNKVTFLKTADVQAVSKQATSSSTRSQEKVRAYARKKNVDVLLKNSKTNN